MKNSFLIFLILLSQTISASLVKTSHAEISIVLLENFSITQNKVQLGIRVDMNEGWHTYWKNPGDSGGAMKINSIKSENIRFDEIKWPTPELIPYPPFMTYGYKESVIFPVTAYIDNNNTNHKFSLNIDFLVCKDICIPQQALLEDSLINLITDNELNYWLKKVPSNIFPTKAFIKENYINLKFSYPTKPDFVYFFVDNKYLVNHSEKQSLIKDGNNWSLTLKLKEELEKIDKLEGTIVIDNNSYLISTDLKTKNNNLNNINIFTAILFAFLGGLILNFMPCVFPIISLKILSFVKLGGDSNKKIKLHSFYFFMGVMFTFILISSILIFFKAIGNNIGWGFQLQIPEVVSILAIIMFVIGLILLSDYNFGASLTKLGSLAPNTAKFSNSFFTGVLAVIVASPCTAPFMGAAIGYAFFQSYATNFLIFASLGIGFSLPYLILGFKPELLSLLPKPGDWMNKLKQFFAFPMFATSLWLLWVFSNQTGVYSLLFLVSVMLVIAFCFWLSMNIKLRFVKISLLFFVSILIFMQTFTIKKIDTNEFNTSSDYTLWSKGIESNYQKENKSYLINFTAAWCITCQANEKLAFSRETTKTFFKQHNIDFIVADWTNKDDDILESLLKYGRNGVPLYVFWKPGMLNPIILPSIITDQILIEKLSDFY